MKMEKIDENTIRVLLGNDDLEERGVTGLDLLSNHKKIERFFYSILEEVDEDHSFTNNDAVTFQVLPSDNGLELLISKALNPDLHGHQGTADGADESKSQDGVTEYIKRQLKQRDLATDEQKGDEKADLDDALSDYLNDANPTAQIVLGFNSFDDWVALAQQLHIESGASNLFVFEHQYFAQLIFFLNETSETFVRDDFAVANEFGHQTSHTAEFLNEYGHKVMDKSALELTRYYFTK